MASAWITQHPPSTVLCPTASSFSGTQPATVRSPDPSPERRSPGARPRQPGVLGNASSQLPQIRPRHARPEGALRRPRGSTGPSGHAGLVGAAAERANRGRPGGRAARFASPCVRARQTEPGAAAATTTRRPPPRQERPAAASSSALPQAHRLLLRRRRRFTSTGRGQTHGARAQPLPPPSPPAPRRPRPPASEPLPLTQPRHPATPAHAGSPPNAGPQPPPTVGRRRAQSAG